MESVSKKSSYGFIGITAGLIALSLAIGHFFLGPLVPPEPVEVSVVDFAGKIKDVIVAKATNKEYIPETTKDVRNIDDYIYYAVIILSIVAIISGFISFIRYENKRLSMAAIVVGTGAILFQYSVMLLTALLFILLVWVVLDSLGISGFFTDWFG